VNLRIEIVQPNTVANPADPPIHQTTPQPLSQLGVATTDRIQAIPTENRLNFGLAIVSTTSAAAELHVPIVVLPWESGPTTCKQAGHSEISCS
jgi:hypothetical protein